MDATRFIAVVLIVAGALGLAYGGFSYTKETHTADLGPLRLSVDENKYVNVPIWAGIGTIMIGGLLLVMRKKD